MTCPICNHANLLPLFEVNDHRIVRCELCGFGFVAPRPRPEELARLYAEGYAVPLERYAASRARNEGRIVDLERWSPERGRLLEVGASYGHGLAIARERGWAVAGVELSPAASRHARETFGLDVVCGDLLEAPLPERGFDAVVMWHVLEHTHDPRAQLRRARALLRPGGVLAVRVPNAGGFGARAAGRLWQWTSPPAHLWYFSAQTLPRLLAQCGFEVVEVATLRGDGNNLYHHALVGAGARLHGVLPRSRREGTGNQEPGDEGTRRQGDEEIDLRGPVVGRRSSAIGRQAPFSRRAWLALLGRAQPLTDALARLTAPAIDALEAAGWGDELVCYARRPEERP